MSKLKLSLLLPPSPLPLGPLIAFSYVHSQEEGMGRSPASADGKHLLWLSQIVSPASLPSPYVGAAPTPSLADTGNLGSHVHQLHSHPPGAVEHHHTGGRINNICYAGMPSALKHRTTEQEKLGCVKTLLDDKGKHFL